MVLEMTLPVGSSAPLHTHADLDDTWYILEGGMVVRCGDDTSVVLLGTGCRCLGRAHTFRVVGDHEARILLVHDNPSFRDLVRDLGSPPRRGRCPRAPCSRHPMSSERVAATHDLSPIGPPLSPEEADVALAAR